MAPRLEVGLRAKFPWLFTIPLFVLACGVYTSAMGSFMDRGMPRASYEMQCPKEQLQVTDLGDGTMGVRGCGKQAIYKEVWGAGWVNDSGSFDAKSPEAQKQAPQK